LSQTVTVPESGTYCVRYLATDEQAREATITSNIIPAELFLIITTPIFFGDSCSTSNGKLAGSLTFEIPRFKLNGAQNFSFNMSSNTTMELSGTALADFSGCDMINGQLVRIIESIDGRTPNVGILKIMIDKGNGYAPAATANIYTIYENGERALLKWANSTASANANPNYISIPSGASYDKSNGTVTFSSTAGAQAFTFYPNGDQGSPSFACSVTTVSAS